MSSAGTVSAVTLLLTSRATSRGVVTKHLASSCLTLPPGSKSGCSIYQFYGDVDQETSPVERQVSKGLTLKTQVQNQDIHGEQLEECLEQQSDGREECSTACHYLFGGCSLSRSPFVFMPFVLLQTHTVACSITPLFEGKSTLLHAWFEHAGALVTQLIARLRYSEGLELFWRHWHRKKVNS